MADVHDRETRHRNMSAIRGKNTKPELWLRKRLHARGFRYRLHKRGLPGKPDLIFRKYNAIIFVNGCYWHGHEGCHLFKIPSTDEQGWRAKIEATKARDRANTEALLAREWRVMELWECAIKGRRKIDADTLLAQASSWLKDGNNYTVIEGHQDK